MQKVISNMQLLLDACKMVSRRLGRQQGLHSYTNHSLVQPKRVASCRDRHNSHKQM